MHPTSCRASNQQTERLLTFTLVGEKYALPLMKVKKVISRTKVTPIRCMPKHFLGIMNLRGQVISIIDLRRKQEEK